jgi:hypothetical protein
MHPVHTFESRSPKIHSNVILPSSPKSSEWYIRFWFSDQNSVCISLVFQRYAIATKTFYIIIWSSVYVQRLCKYCWIIWLLLLPIWIIWEWNSGRNVSQWLKQRTQRMWGAQPTEEPILSVPMYGDNELLVKCYSGQSSRQYCELGRVVPCLNRSKMSTLQAQGRAFIATRMDWTDSYEKADSKLRSSRHMTSEDTVTPSPPPKRTWPFPLSPRCVVSSGCGWRWRPTDV